MASLPYVTSTGNVERALNAIKSAAVPEKVSQDFVKNILKIPGGSGDQITTYLKKIGFAETDGTPSELYKKYRNPTTSGAAVASAIKKAYAPLYVRNEYMHLLGDDELLGLIVEETGLAHDSNPVKLAFSCVKSLKNFADFEMALLNQPPSSNVDEVPNPEINPENRNGRTTPPSGQSIGLNLGYTINLNLPATTDQAVFNAIFKSLKEHLLSNEDG